MAKKITSRTSKTGLSKKHGFRLRWWMGVVIVLIVAVVGVLVLRFSQASTTEGVAPRGPIYWVGDSLSTFLIYNGNLGQSLEANGYSPAYINANPGRSITSVGFEIDPVTHAHQSGLQAVDADNKNVCPGAPGSSVAAYCAAHANKYNPVADAKTVVVFLGTNPELSKDSFSSLQNTMLQKLKTINPTARYVWVDIAAPGDIDKYIDQPSDLSKQQLTDEFVKHRERLKSNQTTIYDNATDSISLSKKYSVISQFRFIWGDQTNPLGEFPNITNQQDCHNFVGDGTHYTPAGSAQLAVYLVNALKTPDFTNKTTMNSATQPTCGFLALPDAKTSNMVNDPLPEATIALPSYGLFSTTDNLYTQQDPQIFTGEPTTTNNNLPPDKQCNPGLYKNTFRKGCIVSPGSPVTIISNQFARPVGSGKKQICIQGYSREPRNSEVSLLTTLQPLVAPPAVPVKDGSVITDKLTFYPQSSRQCSRVFTGDGIKIDQLKFVSSQAPSTVVESVSVVEVSR